MLPSSSATCLLYSPLTDLLSGLPEVRRQDVLVRKYPVSLKSLQEASVEGAIIRGPRVTLFSQAAVYKSAWYCCWTSRLSTFRRFVMMSSLRCRIDSSSASLDFRSGCVSVHHGYEQRRWTRQVCLLLSTSCSSWSMSAS
jgi:hypothetical protein